MIACNDVAPTVIKLSKINYNINIYCSLFKIKHSRTAKKVLAYLFAVFDRNYNPLLLLLIITPAASINITELICYGVSITISYTIPFTVANDITQFHTIRRCIAMLSSTYLIT